MLLDLYQIIAVIDLLIIVDIEIFFTVDLKSLHCREGKFRELNLANRWKYHTSQWIRLFSRLNVPILSDLWELSERGKR